MNELFLEPEPEFDVGNNKEYKIEAIIDSVVYTKEAKEHLSGLYYLVSWKGYSEEESTWEPFSIVMHLRKIIFTFHKDHLEKPTTTFPLLDSAPPMAKPLVKPPVKPFAKKKRDGLISSTKWVKKWDIGRWGFSFLVLVRLKDFFTISMNFGRDTHSASFFNSASFYL